MVGVYVLIGALIFITLFIFSLNYFIKKKEKEKMKELLEWKIGDEIALNVETTNGLKYYKMNNDSGIVKLVKWSENELLIELINNQSYKNNMFFIKHNIVKINKSYSHRKKLKEFEDFQKKIKDPKKEELKQKIDKLIK